MNAATGKTLLFMLLLLSCKSGFSQIKDIGLAFVKNYSKNIYTGGTQNWDIVQEPKTGMMYFANNGGILEFDGSLWQFYRVSNGSVVRSVSIDSSGRIYAGAFNEMGYLEKAGDGRLKYTSLVELLPEQYKNFDEIWRIFQTDFGIVFQSFRYVFIYNKGSFQILKPFSSFGFSFYQNRQFYIVDREQGILVYSNRRLQKLINDPKKFSDTEIRFILPGYHGQLMIGTLNKGIFIYDGKSVVPWNAEINHLLIQNQLFSGTILKHGNFAFGSIQDGLFIADQEGKILQHINRSKGLQNNTVLSTYQDRSDNLWLGLDNGISFVEVSSPVTYFNYCYGIETGYASVVYNGMLYLGTNQGLFARPLNQLRNSSGPDIRLKLVEGTEGQVWTLNVIDGKLFCGHNNGAFLIDGYHSAKISGQRGGWTFLRPFRHPDKIIGGTYNGLVLYQKTSNNWTFSHRIKGFGESSKTLLEDGEGYFWISHGYKGIFRLKLNENLDSVAEVRLFSEKHGLPAKLPCNIIKIDNEVFITSGTGIFRYNPAEKKLVPDFKNGRFFSTESGISQVQTDEKGNRWFFASNKLGVFRLLEDGTYKEISIPFLKYNSSIVPAFEHIYPYDDRNIFIGVLDGFLHYDPSMHKNYQEPFGVFIRKVKLLNPKIDSTLAWQGNKGHDENKIKSRPLSYKNNSLSFTFSAPFFEDPEKTRFRCRLIGYDDNWSGWDLRNIREYTNLHEGLYTFEVQARNIYQNNSTTDSFTFYVSPPFYRTKFAYITYILLIMSVISANFIYFKRRIDRTRLREKLVHEKKMIRREQEFKQESLIAEKEIERLKTEKLVTDIRHKNKELANSTMHLIQKNKFLNLIKDELNGLITASTDENQKVKLRHILKKIDKDLNNEKYWKLFDDYFDEVHQDFLTRLKERHPDLTPKELRLCAYLRMNISSKEIAALLNISLRGVEVSRYRLRKNLQIERDTNLTEYILNL